MYCNIHVATILQFYFQLCTRKKQKREEVAVVCDTPFNKIAEYIESKS